MRILPTRALFLMIGMTVLPLTLSAQHRAKTSHRPPPPGSPARPIRANYGQYDFALRTLDGKSIRLSTYAGKVILVNIWAPWCEPCKLEAVALAKLYGKYHTSGLEIVGVAVQTMESDVRSFMGAHDVRWTIGINDSIASWYGTYGVPDSYLFSPDGSLLKSFVGFAPEKELTP